MAKCKEVANLKTLEEIGVNRPVCVLMESYSIESIVRVARAGNLDSALMEVVGEEYAKRCYLDIQNALSKAGYLRADLAEYQSSFNMMTFMRAAINGIHDKSFFDEASNIYREVRCFSNEEYENF